MITKNKICHDEQKNYASLRWLQVRIARWSFKDNAGLSRTFPDAFASPRASAQDCLRTRTALLSRLKLPPAEYVTKNKEGGAKMRQGGKMQRSDLCMEEKEHTHYEHGH